MPQVKKVYTTLAPGATSNLLLPHIKQALDSAHESSINGHTGHSAHNNGTSPFMRHRRSFTSASSLSTISRSCGNGDNLLSKFVLLQSNAADKKSQDAIKELKDDVCKIYIGNETITKDLAETDFDSLFPRIDVSAIQHSLGCLLMLCVLCSAQTYGLASLSRRRKKRYRKKSKKRSKKRLKKSSSPKSKRRSRRKAICGLK